MPAPKPKTSAAKKAVKKVAKKTPRAKQLRFSSVEDLKSFIQREVERDSYRMVARPSAGEPSVAEAPDAKAPNPMEGSWGAKPSVARQLEEHPATVRDKAPVTAQFIMSVDGDAAAWNALQARMHPPQSPEIRLASYSCEFAQSIHSFVILVTYAELEYQQI